MRKSIILILLVTLFLSLEGCKQNIKDSSKIETVTIGSYFQAVDYAPFLIAKEKGWFDKALNKEGIKVKYQTFEDLAVINDAFLKNELDVVFEAEPPAIVSESANVGIDIMDISCSLTQEILVRTGTDIKLIDDLKGKKLAVLSGTSSHYGVLKLLNEKGISESELTIIDMNPVDAKVAFESNKIDAWAVWPPFVEQQELSGKGFVLPKGDVFIHSIMAVDEDFINAHPEVYRKIDSVFDATKVWISNNSKQAIDIIAKSLKIDNAVVEKAWPKHEWNVFLNEVIVKDIQNKADFLSERKKINKKVNVSEELIELR